MRDKGKEKDRSIGILVKADKASFASISKKKDPLVGVLDCITSSISKTKKRLNTYM
jgi:hypothetical protein